MTTTITHEERTAVSPTPTVPVVRFTVKGQTDAPRTVDPHRAFTIVYDGACKVCQGLVRRLLQWDRHGVFEIPTSLSKTNW